MTTINLLTPQPGFGYAISSREYLMNISSLDTDEQDGIFSRGGKTILNTAIRCTAFSLPYLTYISCSNFTFISHYWNITLGLGKGIVAASSGIQGYWRNDDAKKELAKKMAREAIWHASFACVDKIVLQLGAIAIIPIVTAYVGVGAFKDLFGQSKELHNKCFKLSTGRRAVPKRHGSASFRYPESPTGFGRGGNVITRLFSPGPPSSAADDDDEDFGAAAAGGEEEEEDGYHLEGRINGVIEGFQDVVVSPRLTRSRHAVGTPFPIFRHVVDSAKTAGKRVNAEALSIVRRAYQFVQNSAWGKRAHNRIIHVYS